MSGRSKPDLMNREDRQYIIKRLGEIGCTTDVDKTHGQIDKGVICVCLRCQSRYLLIALHELDKWEECSRAT